MGAKDGRIRVLHVDDEPSLSELVATFLEREDDRFTVETATRVSDGLEILADHDVDCIVSDYDMPGQNGIEFLEIVRRDHPDLPFILYTGKGSEEVASDAISAGVTDYLQKETGSDQYTILANRIGNAVERYRIEREAEQTRTQLRAISENSADAILIIDADSRIRFANPAVEDHFGYEPFEIKGETLTTILPERYREDHLAAMEDYIETGERSVNWSNIEFAGLHRDGTEVPLSVSFAEFKQNGERRFIGILRDISERTRMEAELREREERFRQMAENIQEVVWMSDPAKEELLYVNEAYEEIWGQPTERLYESPNAFLDAVHPEDRDRVASAVDAQGSGGYDEEYRIVRPDGELRWVRDRAVPIENDEGEVYRIVGIASDITAQKRQTKRLQTLVSNLPGVVYRCENDPGWPMAFVKGECKELTGYRPERIENGDVSWGEDIIHPADQDRMWETVQDALDNDRSFEVTYRIRTKDGSTKWMWERGRLVTSDVLDEERLEGFITDITDRKQYEERLQRRNEQYQTVLDNTQEAIFLLDVEDDETFRIAQVNQAEEELLGRSAQEIEGKTLHELYDTETADTAVDAYRRCVEREEPIVDVQEYHLDGETRVFETTLAPVVTDGEIRQVVGVSREITEQGRNN